MKDMYVVLIIVHLFFLYFFSLVLSERSSAIFLLQGHLHTYRFCDNVWTFILQNAQLKSEEGQETVESVKIVACDSKLLTQ